MTTAAKRADSAPDPPQRKLRAIAGLQDEVSEKQIAAQLQKLKEAFLECRLIGHTWHIVYAGPIGGAGLAEELRSRARHNPWNPDGVRVLRCTRCRCRRVDLCSVGYGRRAFNYRLVSRYYTYPEDYKVEGVSQHRELLHEELFRRFASGGKEPSA